MRLRKLSCLLAALALLLSLCACRQEDAPDAPVQPFDFYYRAETIGFSDADGLIRAETRDLGDAPLSLQALVALYLQGPEDGELVSPFPRELTLLSVSAAGSVLTLRLSKEYAALQGVDASIADACIVRTMLGLSEYRRVCIVSEDDEGVVLRSTQLGADDILLSDDRADTETQDLTLYFADAEGRYLLTEKQRPSAALSEQALPQYLIGRLIAGPQTAGLSPTIPVGTVLLDVNVENGVCAVDLNAAFVDNRGDAGVPPHLTLLSIVNTLTELSTVDQVQFFIDGRQQSHYGALPFDGSFGAESRAVGPVHPELRELDGTFCLPTEDAELLYPLTLRVKCNSNESQPEALLRVLYAMAGRNGMRNPLFGTAPPQSVQLEDGVCSLRFAADSLPEGDVRALAERILIATLCAQEEIDAVLIYAADELQPLPAAPEAGWYVQTPLP